MAGAKQVVWVADLQVSKVTEGLQAILNAFEQVTTAFGRELVVQLNVTQFNSLIETLETGFKKLGDSLGTAIADSSLAVIANLEAIGGKADALSGRLSADIATGLAEGATVGADKAIAEIKRVESANIASSERLADRLKAITAKTEYQTARTMDESGAAAQTTFLGGKGITSTNDLVGTINGKPAILAAKMADLAESAKIGQETTKTTEATAAAQIAAFGRVKASVEEERAALVRANLDKQKSDDAYVTNLKKDIATALTARLAAIDRARTDKPAPSISATPYGPPLGPQARASIAAQNAPYGPAYGPEAQAAHATYLKNQKAITDEAKNTAAAHERSGTSLLGNAIAAAKLILLYRVMRDTIREIETLIASFVHLGIDYVKQQEETQANLTGILSASFQVVDANGKIVVGQERMAALSKAAKDLAVQIADVTKNTTISAKDLAGAYELIVAPAVRYKQTTQQILDLSLLAAAAGKSIGLNAKESATQLASILTGKTTSTLAKVLFPAGTADIKALQGTAEGLAMVKARLTDLGAANLSMGDSLESLFLKFQKVLAPLSAKIEEPFFAAFKDFVTTATAFANSQAGKELFGNISAAGAGVSAALVTAGNNIAGSGNNDLAGLVLGAGKAIELLIKLGEVLIQIVKYTVEFLGKISEVASALGEGGMWAAAIIAATFLVYKLGGGFVSAINGSGLLSLAIKAMVPALAEGTAGLGFLSTAALTLGSGVVLAAAGLFFATILNSLAHVISQANLAKSAMLNLSVLDAARGMDNASGTEEKADFGYKMASIVGTKGDTLRRSGADDSQVSLAERKVAAQSILDDIDVALPRMLTQLTELEAQAKKAAAEEALINPPDSKFTQLGFRGVSSVPQGVGTAGPDSPATIAHLKGDVAKLIAERDDALAVLRDSEKVTKLIPHAEGTPPPPKEPTKFQDDSDAEIRALRAKASMINSDEKVLLAQRLISEDDYTTGVIERERKLNEDITVLLADKLKRYREFEALRLADKKNLKKGEADTYIPPQAGEFGPNRLEGTLSKGDENIQSEQVTSQTAAHNAENALLEQQAKQKFAFQTALTEYALGLEAIEDGITGQVADKAEAALQAKLVRLRAMVAADAQMGPQLPGAAGQQAAKDKEIAATEALIPRLRDSIATTNGLKNQAIATSNLAREQTLLDKQYASGRTNVTAYIAETMRLRDAMRASLEVTKGLLEHQLTLKLDPSARTAIKAQIDEVNAKIDTIKTHADDVKVAFQSWVTLFGSIGQSLHVFDVFGSQIGAVGDAFAKAVSTAKQFFSVIQEGKSAVGSIMQAMASAGGSFGSTGGSMGPSTSSPSQAGTGPEGQALTTLASTAMSTSTNITNLGKTSEGLTGGFTGFLSKLGGDKSGGGGGASTILGAMGVAGMAAGVVVGIASAMFAAAVKRDTEAIDKGLTAITKSIADGVQSSDISYRALQKLQADSIAEYSGSKAGRKALDAEMPKILSAMESLQKAAMGVIEAMEKTFQTSANGKGPEADFANVLIDLGDKSNKYLAALLTVNDAQGHLIQKTSQEYIDGVAAMDRLYKQTIADELASLTATSQGNQSEDIAALQKVIQLTDQKTALEKQVSDLNDAEAQLKEDYATLATDKADTAITQAKARVDAVQKILDLEKQISDLELATANSIADIRQRGVLEAQSTIAEQKARDISSVQSAAQVQLAKLQADLANAKGPDLAALEKSQVDANAALDKRTAALAKQALSLQDQGNALMQQINLNNIDLGIATRVAQIEDSQFHLAGDRYQLEVEAGNIQVAQANLKVKQWREVEDLIRSIDLNGKDLFVPPPGFPQIKVTIGDIVINNQDQSSNSGLPPIVATPKDGSDTRTNPGNPTVTPPDFKPGRPANYYYDTQGGYRA